MRRIEVRRGVVRYEKEHSDLVQEAVITLAQRAAMALEDDEAAKVGALFPQWMPGTAYKTGDGIQDGGAHFRRGGQPVPGGAGPHGSGRLAYGPDSGSLHPTGRDRGKSGGNPCVAAAPWGRGRLPHRRPGEVQGQNLRVHRGQQYLGPGCTGLDRGGGVNRAELVLLAVRLEERDKREPEQ